MNAFPLGHRAPGRLAPLLAFAVAYPLLGEGVPDADVGFVRIYWEAFLIPLSLLFGRRSILGLVIGVIAMWLYLVLSGQEHPGPGFLALQPLAFLAALSLASYVVDRYPSLEGYILGMGAFTGFITLTLGGYLAATTSRPSAMVELLVASLIPINIAGPLLLAAGSRWTGRIAARRERP